MIIPTYLIILFKSIKTIKTFYETFKNILKIVKCKLNIDINSWESFMCMLCRSLFVLFFFLAIVLSVLRFTDSDYPFGIFNMDDKCVFVIARIHLRINDKSVLAIFERLKN